MSPPLPQRRYLLLLILLAALAAFAWHLLAPGDDAWARLQAGGDLRVAVDPSFPPFEFLDGNGRLAGFDIDLAREIGRRLGAPVAFQAIAFDGLVDAVLADKADVVISAFPLDPRLTEDVRYSLPYFEAGLVLVVREGSEVAGPQDLAGREVAVEWGSQGDAWARAQGVSIVRQETAEAALAAVANGEADAAVVDAVTAALSQQRNLRILSTPLESEPYVIVLSPRSPKVGKAVDESLAGILSDGTWEALARSYFTLAPLPPPHQN